MLKSGLCGVFVRVQRLILLGQILGRLEMGWGNVARVIGVLICI